MQFFKQFEVSRNFEYLLTIPGFAKVVEIVFLIVSLAIGSQTFVPSDAEWKDDFFIIICIVGVGISVLYLVCHLMSDDLVQSSVNKISDMVFHAVLGSFILFAGSLLTNLAIEHCQTYSHSYSPDGHPCNEFFDFKIGGGVFAIITGVLYYITAILIWKVKELD